MATALDTVRPGTPERIRGDAFNSPAMYEHAKKLAGTLAHGAFTPKHLVREGDPTKTLATCMRVVIQALRWDMDIFAVADETYEVHGRLGYQGKLIIAVVNARANLVAPLRFAYTGDPKKDEFTVMVSGQFQHESEPRTIALSVGQAKTENKMWKSDPEQKLAYSGAIKWARRHCPELIMGVRTVEDLERYEEEQAPAAPMSLAQVGQAMAAIESPQASEPPTADEGPQVAPQSPTVPRAIAEEFKNAKSYAGAQRIYDGLMGPDSSTDWEPAVAEGIEQLWKECQARFAKPEQGSLLT